jgi:hypothetical protein
MKEILITRLEAQIEAMLDTLVEIEKEEQAKPMREMSNWHKTALWMVFFSQVLLKSCRNTIFKNWKLTQEQKEKYIVECAEMTKEHFKNLYWYDSIEEAKKI